MKIGVTGPNGLLGSELVKQGCFPIKSNLLQYWKLAKEFSRLDVDIIIHCAAKTDVDRCEKLPETAFMNNTIGTNNLLKYCNLPIIFISTDFVFDGRLGPYNEEAKPNPINIYGTSKLAAELLVKKRKDTVIVRTTNLFSSIKNNFVLSTLKSLSEKKEVHLPNNIRGNPTYVPFLAEALIKVCRHYLDMPQIINIAGREVVSRYDLGLKIAEVFNLDSSLVVPYHYQGDTPRPVNGGLEIGFAESLEIPIHSYVDGLREMKGTLNAV